MQSDSTSAAVQLAVSLDPWLTFMLALLASGVVALLGNYVFTIVRERR